MTKMEPVSIARTLISRKMCVRPFGTGGLSAMVYTYHRNGSKALTVSIIMKIEKLVAPLGHDTEGILNKCNNDEEPADGGQVAVFRR